MIVWCLWWYENALCDVLDESLVLHGWNSGEIWYSRPSELVSPRWE